MPITKEIVKKIIKDKLLSVTDFNINIAFKVAWVSFIRMGKLIYPATEAKKATFAVIGLTRSNISFAKNNQYVILCLNQSKINTEHTKVKIILAAIVEYICPVATL